jgi:pyridoxal phosphate enzyme (YggS family)
MVTAIADRLADVRLRVDRAAEAADRDPASVTIIAVGKTHPHEVLTAAVHAGVEHLGENRVQEATAKRPLVPAAQWHLIGPLQRNKARKALEAFDVIHTVDRCQLAERLQRLLAEHWPDRQLPVLLEINVGQESQKAGVLPADAPALLECALACPALRVDGLMAIPPFGDDPELSRPHFRDLRRLRDTLENSHGAPLPQLSMGMSHDYEVAVAEGATLVRVGTAIFGPRGR